MSNPNSPSMDGSGVVIASKETTATSDVGLESQLNNIPSETSPNVVETGTGSNGNGEENSPGLGTGSIHLDPPNVPVLPLQVNTDTQTQLQIGQIQQPMPVVKKKPAGILSKSSRKSTGSPPVVVGGNVSNVGGVVELKMEPGTEFETTSASSTIAAGVEVQKGSFVGVTTPSIVKPRRPSVHFAVGDTEQKIRSGSSGVPKQDSGSSRKHRSRKEKLVCRSESPTADLSVDASHARASRQGMGGSVSLPLMAVPGTSASSTNGAPRTKVPSLEENMGSQSEGQANELLTQAYAMKLKSARGATKAKPRVKRVNSGNRPRATGNTTARKRIQNSSALPFHQGSIGRGSIIVKDFPVKKKRVIEIVSPRKRKVDHLEIVKTSSDPIFIRAANKPFKLKNKSRQNRLKFSGTNFNKTSSLHRGQHRVRRPSSASQQSSSSSLFNKQRYNSGSPQKRDRETESPTFPLTLTDDLLWMMEEAENIFSSEGPPSQTQTDICAASSQGSTSSAGQDLFQTDVPVSIPNVSVASPPKRLAIGRRRVESEPPGAVGFEVAPSSPSGSQSCYHIRKEIYFSPSPQYTTAGPAGRRRYSRRRHAKIHPPFDDSHCSFQGHHCPNSKVKGSQFCEKHLDQGPTSGYSHCRYMKDGRQCGVLFPNDPTMTFCEQHASLVAKTEYNQRNPKVHPNATKSIIAKIKIFKEGLLKPEMDDIAPHPDILQIVEEPDIVQEMSLGNFTGGLLEELDSEGERNVNPDKPDYDALKNAGYFTTEEIIQIHVTKLRRLKALYQREKELEWLTRQHKLRFYKEGLEKLRQYGPTRFTTNPYLINKNTDLPKDYLDHQIKQYDAAKAILQTAYKADGSRGLLRLKMLQKTQELARIARASGQKQNDATAETYDSDTDGDSDSGEPRDRRGSSRFSGYKLKCAYNEGYAVRACQNPPVYWSQYCFKHILSDRKQVQWVPCNRRIGPDPSDLCKTPCFRVLEKHGCTMHSPLVMSKHKPLRRSEEDVTVLVDSDNEEEEVTLEAESVMLANLVSDECLGASHLDESINRVIKRGHLEITDTSDSEETDEEGIVVSNLTTQSEEEDSPESQHSQVQT